jgi:hypothetical protein
MRVSKDTGSTSTSTGLTADQRKRGWTDENLEDYRRQRARAHDLVGGFVITPFIRPKRQPEFEHAARWSPLKHRLVR